MFEKLEWREELSAVLYDKDPHLSQSLKYLVGPRSAEHGTVNFRFTNIDGEAAEVSSQRRVSACGARAEGSFRSLQLTQKKIEASRRQRPFSFQEDDNGSIAGGEQSVNVAERVASAFFGEVHAACR